MYLSSPDTTPHWPRQLQAGSQRVGEAVCQGNRSPKGARAVTVTTDREELPHTNQEDATVVNTHAPDPGALGFTNTDAKGGVKTGNNR